MFCCEKEKGSLHHNISVIILAELNPHDPNVSKIINKNRHLLETDNTLKQSCPGNSIFVASKRGKNVATIVIHVTMLLMNPLLLYQNQPTEIFKKKKQHMHNKTCYILNLLYKI